MGRALTILFGLLAFGLLVAHCLTTLRNEVAPLIAQNADAALAVGGFETVAAAADGQHITLTGTVDSQVAKDAAEQAVLGAAGVAQVDNQITIDVLLPPPGPDPTPAHAVETAQAADVIADDVAEATVSSRMGQAADGIDDPPPEPPPVEPVAESIQVVLQGSARRADVAGLALSSDVAPDRTDALLGMLSMALPDWEVNSGLSASANVPTELAAALQRVLPVLTSAETATLDADAQGIRVNAQLASFTERADLQAALEGLTESTALGGEDLSWMLDSPPPTEDGCQQAFNELLERDSIMFTTSKAEIRPRSFALLDKLVEVARDCEVRVEIEGHT